MDDDSRFPWIKILCEKGCVINAVDDNGDSALYDAKRILETHIYAPKYCGNMAQIKEFQNLILLVRESYTRAPASFPPFALQCTNAAQAAFRPAVRWKNAPAARNLLIAEWSAKGGINFRCHLIQSLTMTISEVYWAADELL